MCEVNAYLIENDKETLIMERVYKLDLRENKVHIENLFGEQKFLSASLKEINFEKNRMVLENTGKQG
jgi:predicted RNA-binding protein